MDLRMKFEIWTGRLIRVKNDLANARRAARRSSALDFVGSAMAMRRDAHELAREKSELDETIPAALQIEVRPD